MKQKLMALGGIVCAELTIVMLIAAGMTLHDLLVMIRDDKVRKAELKRLKKELEKTAKETQNPA